MRFKSGYVLWFAAQKVDLKGMQATRGFLTANQAG